MKKEWILLLASVALTLAVALGLIRWLAPGLLGIATPVDLQVVQVSREVPPFYDLVFPSAATPGDGALINDPYTGHRRRAMVPENDLDPENRNAPFDLLGFRNRAVPVVADVVALGDSLTLGLNATVDQNWPAILRAMLAGKRPVVYNMAVGGWGTLQYLYMLEKAAAFRPRVVVVAISTGGEPLKAVRMAYTNPRWAAFRRSAERPAGAQEHWPPKKSEA